MLKGRNLRKIQRYGYRPDLGDHRDHIYQKTGVIRPKSVDLRAKMPPVWDQGQLGSCTAFALTGAVSFLHGFVGSQLWLYFKERFMEGTVRMDAGAEIRDGIKILAQQGLPPEDSWPYDISKFTKRPPATVDKLALQDLISEYQRLQTIDDYMDCLASGSPFAVGITLYENFESEEMAQTGVGGMPEGACVGGHAICVVGYNEDGSWLIRNSWGPNWGMNGYFTLPHEYLASTDLASDAWVIKA